MRVTGRSWMRLGLRSREPGWLLLLHLHLVLRTYLFDKSQGTGPRGPHQAPLAFHLPLTGLPAPAHPKGTCTRQGAALETVQSRRQWGLLPGFGPSLFLNVNRIRFWRSDSMFSVNSCVTFIPLPVSTIWSIYKVFHLILFWDRQLVWKKGTNNH